ncbi:MAG: hypothetical protein WBV78_17905, partial [Roseobacter sp.]
PWHQGATAAVDHGCIRRINRVGGEAFDKVAFDEHIGILDALSAYAIKHMHVGEQGARGIILRNGGGKPYNHGKYGNKQSHSKILSELFDNYFSVLRFDAREPRSEALVECLVVNEQKFGNHHIGMVPAHKDRANATCSEFLQFFYPIRMV